MKHLFSALFLLTSLLFSSCCVHTSDDSVEVSLGTNFIMSNDLFDFVTPTITYTDYEGVHKIEMTPDMCEENSFEIDNTSFSNYSRNWDIKAKFVPGEVYTMTLSFNPKEGVTANPDNRYYFNERLDINSYSYRFNNGYHYGTITNIDINISINLGQEKHDNDKRLLKGMYADEYIRQLCASPQTIKVQLDKEGHFIINDKQY